MEIIEGNGVHLKAGAFLNLLRRFCKTLHNQILMKAVNNQQAEQNTSLVQQIFFNVTLRKMCTFLPSVEVIIVDWKVVPKILTLFFFKIIFRIPMKENKF